MRPLRSLCLTTFAVLSVGCEPATTVPETPSEPPTGAWSATIELPGGEIETAFELHKNDAGWRATLVNGQERYSIDEVTFSNGQLKLRFPVFNNEIQAKLEGNTLIGDLILVKLYGETQVLPFRARAGSEPINPQPTEKALVDLSGRWSVWFHNEDGSSSPSIGEFAQRGSRLFGTFVNPDGDYRYLAGYVDGNRFALSTFDGAHAYLFTGEANEEKISNASYWSGNAFFQTWSAVRDPDAALPDPYDRTRLRADAERLTFEFPNEKGEMVSLQDERYAGKVVIVALAGTWCPNCNDEARYLSRLYNDHQDDGLEIVNLMFEHFDDAEVAAEQIRKYREKHAIEYETLVAGISDKTRAAQQLPQLDAVWAFPTTIFVDRTGRVRTIHTGFRGPGTGKHFEQQKDEFQSLVVELIAEQDTLIEAEREEPVPAE